MRPNESLPTRKKILPVDLIELRRQSQPIVMVTAYDTPSARMADAAGVDAVLVGDSAGTTVLGESSTVPVTMSDMLVFSRAVVRGITSALVVADMPFGSYQVSEESAVRNAVRLVKRTGVDAVKLEGAGRTLTRISGIIDAGIPVMGHIGLTPQSATQLGGYKAQGRTAAAAARLVDEARALERAGCFAIVLEAIPALVAEEITASVRVPTIGIGAGAQCSGQVLVWHDLLGLSPEPLPRFVKTYANLREPIETAIRAYADDVRAGTFPSAKHTYAMPDAEEQRFASRTTSGKK
jgi:3-methyl-2-oxobutanoate hydroxymethyltransferase